MERNGTSSPPPPPAGKGGEDGEKRTSSSLLVGVLKAIEGARMGFVFGGGCGG